MPRVGDEPASSSRASGSALLLALACALPSGAGAERVAQTAESPQGSGFTIDWFTLDSGGGSSSGAGFGLDGTFGQPDAGDASGSGYTLRGGFWYGEVPELMFSNGFE